MICAGVCSGISAPAVAWRGLGWKWAFESEIEPFPSAVLYHHRSEVPNYGDMNDYRSWPDTDLDILIGGTPCQSFSVAGLRQGLDDPRGNLALVFIGLVDKYRPRWVVWENVPGVLSSNGGRDFEAFVRGMAEIGYFGAWRVLDAQWFGVAQRRRRVFAIFCPGDWRPAAAVLFEPESLRGDSPPSRKAGEGLAPSLAARTRGGGGLGTEAECDGGLIPEVSPALKARDHKGPSSDGDGDGAPLIVHSLRGEGFDASEDGTGRGTPLVPVAHVDVMPTIRAAASQNGPGHGARSGDSKDELIVPVAYNITPSNSNKDYNARPAKYAQAVTTQTGNAPSARGGDVVAFAHQAAGKQTTLGYSDNGTCQTLGANQTPAVAFSENQQGMAVRRLAPRECERLQGFPDDFTAIPWRNKPASKCPDGPRYKALGNSMAVPVVRWIGERIAMFEGRQ